MSTSTSSPQPTTDRRVRYLPLSDPFMQAARVYAQQHSLDAAMPNAVAVVRNGWILGIGANGSDFHETNPGGCIRKQMVPPAKSGEHYDKCEGCHPRNHGEPSGIRAAEANGHDVRGADVILFGHYYCCDACWEVMEEKGIRYVYLLEGSSELFDKTHPNNIVEDKRQFEATL